MTNIAILEEINLLKIDETINKLVAQDEFCKGEMERARKEGNKAYEDIGHSVAKLTLTTLKRCLEIKLQMVQPILN